MLGYDTQAHKLGAMVISGTISAAAGAFYGLLFGYAGASFGAVPHSILPLLYVLLGGAGNDPWAVHGRALHVLSD